MIKSGMEFCSFPEKYSGGKGLIVVICLNCGAFVLLVDSGTSTLIILKDSLLGMQSDLK